MWQAAKHDFDRDDPEATKAFLLEYAPPSLRLELVHQDLDFINAVILEYHSFLRLLYDMLYQKPCEDTISDDIGNDAVSVVLEKFDFKPDSGCHYGLDEALEPAFSLAVQAFTTDAALKGWTINNKKLIEDYEYDFNITLTGYDPTLFQHRSRNPGSEEFEATSLKMMQYLISLRPPNFAPTPLRHWYDIPSYWQRATFNDDASLPQPLSSAPKNVFRNYLEIVRRLSLIFQATEELWFTPQPTPERAAEIQQTIDLVNSCAGSRHRVSVIVDDRECYHLVADAGQPAPVKHPYYRDRWRAANYAAVRLQLQGVDGKHYYLEQLSPEMYQRLKYQQIEDLRYMVKQLCEIITAAVFQQGGIEYYQLNDYQRDYGAYLASRHWQLVESSAEEGPRGLKTHRVLPLEEETVIIPAITPAGLLNLPSPAELSSYIPSELQDLSVVSQRYYYEMIFTINQGLEIDQAEFYGDKALMERFNELNPSCGLVAKLESRPMTYHKGHTILVIKLVPN
jgi:hypothetical protein